CIFFKEPVWLCVRQRTDRNRRGPSRARPGVTVTAAQCAALQANCSSNIDQRRILELTNPSGVANLLGNMTQFDDGGTQRYNGLLLNATWRKGNVAIGMMAHAEFEFLNSKVKAARQVLKDARKQFTDHLAQHS